MDDGKDRAMFLSLHPEYARAIFDGSKSAEVRRIRPKASPGMIAFLYATSPVREVVGTGRIMEIVQAPAKRLWLHYGSRTAISEQQFRQYLIGASAPTVLVLDRPAVLVRPVSLERLRTLWGNFHPPQSYRFVAAAPLQALAGVARETQDSAATTGAKASRAGSKTA